MEIPALEIVENSMRICMLYANDKFIYRVADFTGNSANIKNTWRDNIAHDAASNMVSENSKLFGIQYDSEGNDRRVKITASLDNFDSAGNEIQDINMFYVEMCLAAMDFPYYSEHSPIYVANTAISRNISSILDSLWEGKFWLSFSDLDLTENVDCVVLEYSCTINYLLDKPQICF